MSLRTNFLKPVWFTSTSYVPTGTSRKMNSPVSTRGRLARHVCRLIDQRDRGAGHGAAARICHRAADAAAGALRVPDGAQ